MATIRVTNQSELVSALKTAAGGDNILLADGNYGDLTIKNDYTSTVTIQAENPLGASFERIEFSGATNVAVDGLQFTKGLAIKAESAGISVLNSDVDGPIYCRTVDGLVIDNVDVSCNLSIWECSPRFLNMNSFACCSDKCELILPF